MTKYGYEKNLMVNLILLLLLMAIEFLDKTQSFFDVYGNVYSKYFFMCTYLPLYIIGMPKIVDMFS